MGVLTSIFLHLRRQRPRGGRGGERKGGREGDLHVKSMHIVMSFPGFQFLLAQLSVTIDMTFELKLPNPPVC